MTARDELAALIDTWRGGQKKRTKSKAKAKDAKVELASALTLAELARDADRSDALIDALAHAAEAFPDERDIRRSFASALADAGRVGEAIAEFEERLQANADDAGDLVDVAALYERANRSDLAVDRLRRAVDLYVGSKELDLAIPAARRLIELEPQSLETATELISLLRDRDPALLADGIEHLADVYRERGKLGQEAAACGELLALRPDREDVRARLTSIYTRILEVDPEDPDAWTGLTTADPELANQLRVLLAQATGLDALPTEGGSVISLEHHQAYAMRKARELIDSGDLLGASLCLERVVRTDPQPRNRMLLAHCYQGVHREAQAAQEALIALAGAELQRDQETAAEALSWLSEALPSAREPLTDALILNHSPRSADVLYEELRSVWDEAADAARGVGAAEASE